MSEINRQEMSLIDRVIYFFLENKLMVFLLMLSFVGGGLYVIPFDLLPSWFHRDPVPVDAIPDIGENQQIVFTEWMGRSPQDVEEQVTYPLSVSLQGIPGVKTIRSVSEFGFSSIYIIFKEDVDFYWCRSRILERLSTATKGLPEGVMPSLGPDATALGQVFWYTLEGRDENDLPTSGWVPEEIRSIQDWYVRYALQSTEGISEVASVGGFVKEYQIDVNPEAMRAYRIRLQEIFEAVHRANIDVGAKTIEWNGVEYIVRGIGFIKKIEDLENVVITTRQNIPIYIKNVAKVQSGPAFRRGALDKEGTEVVGGVAVVRHGENPLAVIERLKQKIAQISPGLPKKALKDGRISQLRIIPFYDRTQLIKETLATLSDALINEIIITIVVILLFLMNFRISLIISLTLPLSVLSAFIAMKYFKVDSNIMSLGGIAIAIGTVVDMGIIMSENITRQYEEAGKGKRDLATAFGAASEVGSAVLTAIATTVVGFLPVFALEGPEGKLFKPLAYTKTFALIASIVCALTIVPAFCHLLLGDWKIVAKIGTGIRHFFMRYAFVHVALLAAFLLIWWAGLIILAVGFFSMYQIHHAESLKKWAHILFLALGLLTTIFGTWWLGLILLGITLFSFVHEKISPELKRRVVWMFNLSVAFFALAFMTSNMMPLGLGKGFWLNYIAVSGGVLLLTVAFGLIIEWFYRPVLTLLLNFKKTFLALVVAIILMGISIGFGFDTTFFLAKETLILMGVPERTIVSSKIWIWGIHTFPGMGKEFMPPLDEGTYLYMPTVMPHASIAEALDIIEKQDKAIRQIPEVAMVVGKLGRVESALDPAPLGMFETIIHYKPEYRVENGIPVRQWREHIKTPDDIWNEIVKAAAVLGSTSAPKLQPIITRVVMLQTGMRASMGIKIRRASTGDLKKALEEMEQFGFQIEKCLKEVPGVQKNSVVADRVVGKPYLEFHIDRERIARYGVNIRDVQDIIEIAIGGIPVTMTLEGRERYPIRVRYERELRDSLDALERILVPTSSDAQVPLTQIVSIQYVRGPEMIKSEDGFLVTYILFDKAEGYAEVDVVENAEKYLQEKERNRELVRPSGTSYSFAGSYENQIRSQTRLQILIPLSLFIIFLLIYLHFRKMWLTLIVFIAIPVTLSGGFLLLWLYAQPWFLDFSLFGISVREMLHIRVYNLSVAVWVGFLALFGIATDDGVVMGTYLEQAFSTRKITSILDIRAATLEAGLKRIRPCLMTTATTILALLPVLTSSGRGSDVAIPMALPSVGGMTLELITMFVVPVCYCGVKEMVWKTDVSQT